MNIFYTKKPSTLSLVLGNAKQKIQFPRLCGVPAHIA